jgi:hypothetical protein
LEIPRKRPNIVVTYFELLCVAAPTAAVGHEVRKRRDELNLLLLLLLLLLL